MMEEFFCLVINAVPNLLTMIIARFATGHRFSGLTWILGGEIRLDGGFRCLSQARFAKKLSG